MASRRIPYRSESAARLSGAGVFPTASTVSYRPSFRRAFIALAHSEMPAPISRSSPAFSKTTASKPTCHSAIAAESHRFPRQRTTMALTGSAALLKQDGLALDELLGQRDQLVGQERFAQDPHGSVRPLTQPAGGRVPLRDREDHGYLLGLRHCLQAVAGFQAVYFGHTGVHNYEVHPPAQGLLERLLTVCSLDYPKTGVA